MKANNVRYGIMNSYHEKTMLQKAGIKEQNLCHSSRMNELLQSLQMGDGICVATIKSFAVSAYDLVQKLQWLSVRGIDFASLNEKYLNFSSIHVLPDATVDLIRNIAQRENEFVKQVQNSKMSQEVKNELISRIQWESLTDIAMIFRSNGIKRRNA